MPVKITGMNSGLDTESIVQDLVKAYSMKKDKYVKSLKKHEWTMEAWKSTNTKLYGFYSGSLASMKLSSNYNMRKASVSNSSVANVTAGSNAVVGTQSLSVKQMATTSYLTGGKITDEDGKTYATDTKLSDLGISDGVLSLNGKDIDISAEDTLGSLTAKMKEAGVNANYDANNGRFFISAKNSGEANEFTLVAKDGNALNALKKLGIFSVTDKEKAEYAKLGGMTDSDKKAATDALYLKNYKNAQNDELKAAKAQVSSAQASLDKLAELRAKYEKLTAPDYDPTKDYKDDEGEGAKTAQEKYEADLASLQEEIASYDEDELNATLTEQQAIVDAKSAILEKSDSELLADADASMYADAADTVEEQVSFGSAFGNESLTESAGSSRIEGKDAQIYLNGAFFTGSTNTFSINGLTIEVTGTTNPTVDENGKLIEDTSAVSVTTSVDTKSVYDKIVNFLKEYNEMISYVDGLYYADSAKGYEPLTDDEKESMTDKQIEDWEKKIKDSLLRRDDTLGALSSGLKSKILGTTLEKDGKTYTLASFGIATTGYFTSDYAQRGTFHIDGNKDDPQVAGKTDKLMAAIATDPDAVVEYFQKLSTTLHDSLTKQMSSSTLSSAFTIYNDKQMSSQYSDYKDLVKEWEDKIDDYEDYYTRKFTAMEKALAKLQSSTTALSGLMGG